MSGEIARELQQAAPYPFALRGTQTQPAKFRSLPREWENRVTSLEVTRAVIEAGPLLQSLDYARTLTTLNLTGIELEGGVSFRGRVILPLLTSFTLDLLRPGFVAGKDRHFPEPITETYLRSLLFFDKDFDENRDNIVPPNTNIDLSVHIFKLVHLNILRGEISLQQIPFAVRILQEITENTG